MMDWEVPSTISCFLKKEKYIISRPTIALTKIRCMMCSDTSLSKSRTISPPTLSSSKAMNSKAAVLKVLFMPQVNRSSWGAFCTWLNSWAKMMPSCCSTKCRYCGWTKRLLRTHILITLMTWRETWCWRKWKISLLIKILSWLVHRERLNSRLKKPMITSLKKE